MIKVSSRKQFRISQLSMALLGLSLLLGSWIRVHGALEYPFLADEPRITQSGVRDMLGMGPDLHLGTGLTTQLFGVPLRNGQFLGPLWWWMQTTVIQLIPGHDDILYRGVDTRIYRVLPLLWGFVGLAAFYRLSSRLLPDPIPALVTLFLSAHDLHFYMSSKAQYTETVLFFATILMALVLVRSRVGARGCWILCFGSALALATFLVKGIALAVVMIVVIVIKIVSSTTPALAQRIDLPGLIRNVRIFLIVLTPLFVWWAGSEWFFLTHPVRVSDLGYFGHLWEPTLALTLGYGEQVKSFTTGPWYWPLLVYSHADIWPTLSFLAMPISFGVIAALVRVTKGGRRRPMYIYILVAIVLQLGVQLNKGVDGGRYHMLYLPASLLASGIFFEWLWLRAEMRVSGRSWGAAAIFIVSVYLYLMLGWQHWLFAWEFPGRLGSIALLIGLASGLLYLFGRYSSFRRGSILLVAGVGVWLSLVRGPLHWGLFAYEEPGSINPHLREIETMYHPVYRMPTVSIQSDAVYSENLRLLGYDFSLRNERLAIVTHWRVEYKVRTMMHKVYAFLNKVLDLEFDKRLSEPYHLFLHLLNKNSGDLAYGLDELMRNDSGVPVDQWSDGEIVSMHHIILLSELPTGDYRLGIGIYDFESGERLQITEGTSVGDDWLYLQDISVP